MCLLGWAKSSTTKPSCAHQHCSLQGKKRRQRWLRAYVGWGRGLVFNHKDRPSMALPWTTMYEAFSLKIAGERGPWVRKHLYRNNSVKSNVTDLTCRHQVCSLDHMAPLFVPCLDGYQQQKWRQHFPQSERLWDLSNMENRFWSDTNSMISSLHYETWKIMGEVCTTNHFLTTEYVHGPLKLTWLVGTEVVWDKKNNSVNARSTAHNISFSYSIWWTK